MITCYLHSEHGALLAAHTFRGARRAEYAARWADLYAGCGAITIVGE